MPATASHGNEQHYKLPPPLKTVAATGIPQASNVDPTIGASIQTLVQLVQGLSVRQSQQDDRISQIVASLSQINQPAPAKLATQHVASTPEPQPSPAIPNLTQPVAATLESQPSAAIPKTLHPVAATRANHSVAPTDAPLHA